MESHGRINSGPHSSSLSPAGSSGRFENIIKGYSRPLCQLWKQVNMHRTLRPLLGPPRARSLHFTSLPYRGYVGGPAGPACTVSGCRGVAQPSCWLLWTIWLCYAIQFTRRPPKFRGIHLTAVKAADAHVLWGNHCPTGEGRDETGLSSRYEGRVFQPLHHCAQEKRWVTTNLGSTHSWTGPFINLLSRCSCRSASSGASLPEIGLQRSTCTQGSHFSFQRPGGEPASAAPGGGRHSPCFALSRPSIEILRWQDAKLQDLRPALCLSQRPAERECRLQAEDGPLDSGCHHPGLSGTGCALPVQVESSLYKKCGILLGAGSWRLADRYL